MKQKTIFFLLICAFSAILGLQATRSPHRPQHATMPFITTKWLDDQKTYALYHSNLRVAPLFRLYDKKFLSDHSLPPGPIAYRYHPTIFVHGELLTQLIENFIQEIKQKKKEFKDFTILKQRDFNKKMQTGLIIAKFKNYPFVVKVFIETPQSFVKPFGKGFEPCCFFMMGGSNRYLNGFTRIKNLLRVVDEVKKDPYWASCVDFPRKWFFIPRNTAWFELAAHNVGPYQEMQIQLPSTYVIIADYIMIDRTLSLHRSDDRVTALALSNYLQQQVDPHINNYVIEQNTGKIIPIDYEHFPTMVGLDKPQVCTSYIQWYSHLSCKMFYNTFTQSKKDRLLAQHEEKWPLGFFKNPDLIVTY